MLIKCIHKEIAINCMSLLLWVGITVNTVSFITGILCTFLIILSFHRYLDQAYTVVGCNIGLFVLNVRLQSTFTMSCTNVFDFTVRLTFNHTNCDPDQYLSRPCGLCPNNLFLILGVFHSHLVFDCTFFIFRLLHGLFCRHCGSEFQIYNSAA